MTWIKISDDGGGTYALQSDPDILEVKTLAEIDTEIAALAATKYEGNQARIMEWVQAHWHQIELGRHDLMIDSQIADLRLLKDELNGLD